MKSLKTLIKIHRHKLDELRRDMVSIESKQSGLEHGITRLQNELDNEMHLAKKSTELQGYIGDFAKRIKQRQQSLRQEIVKLQEEAELLRTEISREFSEVKKYEIALQNVQQRAREEQARKENIEISDLAIGQYQRHKDGSDA